MILLDTHAVLWWKAGGDRLSPTAADAIAAADALLVSAISCWEVGMLVELGRIVLDREVPVWVAALLAEEPVRPVPLSAASATAAALLGRDGFHGDPADRFLYATAREHAVPLVTKDERITSFARRTGDVRIVW